MQDLAFVTLTIAVYAVFAVIGLLAKGVGRP